MTVQLTEDGGERYVTQGGVTITRRRHDTAYEGAIEAYIDGLDSRRGCVFSSNYEYPGRYTRWDTAMIDPPVVVTARGRAMRIEALNRRGEQLLKPIKAVLNGLAAVNVTEAGERLIKLQVAEPGRVVAEEERSRVPTVFTVLRALVDLFRSG